MGLSIGFLFLLLSIVIPGFIFKRVYFFGEFSKQFTTKDPILKSILYGILPGIVIHLLLIPIFELFTPNFVSVGSYVSFQKSLFSDGGLSPQRVSEIDNSFFPFVTYLFVSYIFSAILAFGTSRLIFKKGYDVRWKILRFQNHWYYIFSGKFLDFPRVISVHEHLGVAENKENKENKVSDIIFVWADIVVKSSDQKNNFYSGVVADYELDSKDISQLDKIYLTDTHRYSEVKRPTIGTNLHGGRVIEKKKIPGEIFILDAKNAENINLTFVRKKQRAEGSSDSKDAVSKSPKIRYVFLEFLILITVFYYSLALLFKFNHIKFVMYTTYIQETNGHYFTRIITFLFYYQIVALFIKDR